MEWLKKQYRAWNDHFFPKSNPVAWNEVIQLDPALDKNPTHKAHIVADLAKWQNTAAGQKMLVSLKDAQSRIPNSEHWNSPSKFVLTDPSDSAAYHRDLAAIEARHTDSKKLFLYISPNKEEKFSTYDRYTDGGYFHDKHIVAINPSTLNWDGILVPRIVNGKKQATPETFIEVLQHETQHAVDSLNNKFAVVLKSNVEKPYTYACKETRALHAEQALQSELGLARRYAYSDINLELRRKVAQGATATPEAYKDLRNQLIKMASVDIIGCSVESPSLLTTPKGRADAAALADKALKEHGIKITR